MKITLTTCIPSPYQVDLFQALAGMDGVALKVLYWRSTTAHFFKLDPGDGYEFSFPKRFKIPFANDVFCPGIAWEVIKADYDMFVVSGVGPTSFVVIPLLVILKKKWYFWAERPHPFDPRKGIKGRLKRWFWKFVGRKCTGFIGIGKVAVEEYRKLGVPGEKLFSVPYSPNLGDLLVPSRGALEGRNAIRESLGLDKEEFVFLYVGALIERKGVDLIIEACRIAFRKCKGYLLVVGEGTERVKLEKVAESIRGRVAFVGAKHRPELLHYYLASDAFLFASRYDGWAVVVNEAMGAGLPCIVSDAVGAAREMVFDGENGFLVRNEDVLDFAVRIQILAEASSEEYARYAKAARKVAVRYSADSGAGRMYTILKNDCANRRLLS